MTKIFEYYLSTHNIVHKIGRNGYLYCNSAIGKMKSSQNIYDKKYKVCKNCLRFI